VNTLVSHGESLRYEADVEEGTQAVTHFEEESAVGFETEYEEGGFQPSPFEDYGELEPAAGETLEVHTPAAGQPSLVAKVQGPEPGWWSCTKSGRDANAEYTGGYTDKLCSVASPGGDGRYELTPGIGKGKGLKGKGGAVVLHNVIPGKGDIKVECASAKDAGKVAAPRQEFGVTAEFKKCKALGTPCQSAGAGKQTIKTAAMAGELGYLNEEGPVVGLSLTSEAAPDTGYIAEFECTGLAKVRVKGAAIATQAGDVNVISTGSEAIYTVGPYLGELAPGYTPLVNPPAFATGAVGVLLTELNGPETGNTWQPEGGLPSGQEGTFDNRGEALMVKA
jgi:hypothetical protein